MQVSPLKGQLRPKWFPPLQVLDSGREWSPALVHPNPNPKWRNTQSLAGEVIASGACWDIKTDITWVARRSLSLLHFYLAKNTTAEKVFFLNTKELCERYIQLGLFSKAMTDTQMKQAIATNQNWSFSNRQKTDWLFWVLHFANCGFSLHCLIK